MIFNLRNFFLKKKLQESGIDVSFWLNVSDEERYRRAEGRRIDPQTEIIYHLEDNPPPTDVKGLIDRLKIIDDPRVDQVSKLLLILIFFYYFKKLFFLF